MESLKQGEILLVLVKRDGRAAEEIANDMGVDKSYLPKLYKKDKLPRKPFERAKAVFADAEKYFAEKGEKWTVVEEPQAVYRTASAVNAAGLEKENADLQEQVARLKQELEKLSARNDQLTETVFNLSKRS
jgi:hypothetical protein